MRTFLPPTAISLIAPALGSFCRVRDALYSSSNVNCTRPLPIEPVIFEAAPAAPPTADPNKLLTPVPTPTANSAGPSTIPFMFNSQM